MTATTTPIDQPFPLRTLLRCYSAQWQVGLRPPALNLCYITPKERSKRERLIDNLKTQSGFTMVELLIAIILVSIVAVIAVPRFATAPTLDGQTQQLLSDLRYTQMLAITHGQRFRLNFTLPSSYSITNLSGTTIPNPSTGTNTITLLSGVTISGLTNLANNLVAFDENGIPYTNSTATTALATNATITITTNGLNRIITITPQTGNMVAS